jgi:protease-4
MRLLLLFALAAAPLAARAQTATLTALDPSRGANLPPTSAALADEAFAAVINPAGLARAPGLQFDYAFERSLARAQTAHGAYLSLGGDSLAAALTADWVGGARAAASRGRCPWPPSLGVSYH